MDNAPPLPPPSLKTFSFFLHDPNPPRGPPGKRPSKQFFPPTLSQSRERRILDTHPARGITDRLSCLKMILDTPLRLGLWAD